MALRALLSGKSLGELRHMSVFVNGSTNSNYDCAYKPVITAINDFAAAKEAERDEREANITASSPLFTYADATARVTASDAAGRTAVSESVVRQNMSAVVNMDENIAESGGNIGEIQLTYIASQENNITPPMHQSTPVRGQRAQPTNDRNENNEPSTMEREKNIVISNIPEDLMEGGDKAKIEEMLRILGCDGVVQDIKKITRLGTQNDRKIRLIKVEMRNQAAAKYILENKQALSEIMEYANVYINEDLSKADRARAYQARLMKRNTAGESLNNLGNRRSQRNTLNDFMPRQVSHQRTNYREEEGLRGSYRRPDLPEGWVAMQSRGTGKEYYVNEIIGGKGQYEFPTEPARGLNGFGVNTE